MSKNSLVPKRDIGNTFPSKKFGSTGCLSLYRIENDLIS